MIRYAIPQPLLLTNTGLLKLLWSFCSLELGRETDINRMVDSACFAMSFPRARLLLVLLKPFFDYFSNHPMKLFANMTVGR